MTILVDLTSEAARDQKTWALKDVSLPLHIILWRSDSLLQSNRTHIEGHFNAKIGTLLEVNLILIHFPSSDRKDSSFVSRDKFQIHDSDP